jgi:hypothetical protein
MKSRIFVHLAALALAAPLTVLAAPAGTSAAATATAADHGTAPIAARGKTQCVKGSGTYSGRCFTLLRSAKHVTPVESVPLENRSSHKATMHCSFSRTISRSISYGASLSASAEASYFSVVKASVTATVSKEVNQTASQATEAGGSIVLRPGESVTCLRTYGYVTVRVKDYTYRGTTSNSTIRRGKVPSTLGVRIID